MATDPCLAACRAKERPPTPEPRRRKSGWSRMGARDSRVVCSGVGRLPSKHLPGRCPKGYRSRLNMVRVLLASALIALPVAARSPLHTWTDKEGVLHVEDVPPPRVRASPRKA